MFQNMLKVKIYTELMIDLWQSDKHINSRTFSLTVCATTLTGTELVLSVNAKDTAMAYRQCLVR